MGRWTASGISVGWLTVGFQMPPTYAPEDAATVEMLESLDSTHISALNFWVQAYKRVAIPRHTSRVCDAQ